MTPGVPLPPGVTVFERGWLSSNNVLILGSQRTALVDSGYCTHVHQTLALIAHALGGRVLDDLVNTHLHSDHCGGNAALQARYAQLLTRIPPGHAAQVRQWDDVALSYVTTGQQCPRFDFQGLVQPGQEVLLGDTPWQVHSAPGHDPHAVMLFEPRSATLISGDALWERGFGVIFPELEGLSAYDEVAASLDLIEALQPRCVIPGHGSVFADVASATAFARRRLQGFRDDPLKHALYAAKVLLKFKLLELQTLSTTALRDWARHTAYVCLVHQRYFSTRTLNEWIDSLVQDLQRSGAATCVGDTLYNA